MLISGWCAAAFSYVALELPASVAGLAATLSQDPQLVAQVLHRDRYAADSVVGVAHIPMAPLMQEPWLDGYAPVFTSGNQFFARREEQVLVGAIRVILTAEELVPVPGLHKKTQKTFGNSGKANTQFAGLEESLTVLKNHFGKSMNSKAVGVQTEKGNVSFKEAESEGVFPDEQDANLLDAQSNFEPEVQHISSEGRDGYGKLQSTTNKEEELRRRPEYELAWEFELWRRAEEVKWRADLKEKEVARLGALESEWKRREQERTIAVDKMQVELANIESKLRSKLLILEKRERALVLAEEEASLRRDALERDYAQRTADAQVAVKRLQSECEHRLELEGSKYAALKEQYEILEQRMGIANATLTSIEREFADYRATQRTSSEAELTGQIMLLKQQYHDLQGKAELTLKSRNEYKAQVLHMAKELAHHHRHQPQEKVSETTDDRRQIALPSLMESHAHKTREEKFELQTLKEQINRLQMNEQTAMAAATAAAVATAAVSRQFPEVSQHSRGDCFSPCDYAVKAETEPEEGKNWVHFHDNPDPIHTIHYNENKRPAKDVHENLLKDGSSDVSRKQNLSIDKGKEFLRKPLIEVEQKRSARVDTPEQRISYSSDQFELPKGSRSYMFELSEFQKSEILRLTKQRDDLLQTGVYTVNDRIIRGLDQEIHRLESVDTNVFNL
ncbi:hypothetical protein O6H91_22G054400 [Diphasiastrum complanatum]|uniref:Uncharacterized protein n=1 Tax=Diphasiastrum complanatum TaxID=34168 RepID=A0ACC2AFJ3_DIPCM|nr:hypothetical protein O6H91_22G054400 [Diphasiastrum complanatum]